MAWRSINIAAGCRPARGIPVAVVVVASLLRAMSAFALDIVDDYSPRNRERPPRKRTDYIILHTTEGAAKGSLAKVKRNGEAHYFMDERGRASRIIQRDRVALHCGRSMWNGRVNIDEYAIGIEVVGYHNKDITAAQYAALKELLSQLQRIYGVPDDHVLTHSMVAYGAPNRWHPRSHRGRKRCGMQFARRSVRLKLGLTSQPACDPDVAAGRLVNADPYLSRVLYGSARDQDAAVAQYSDKDQNVIGVGRTAWDIARDQYDSANVLYTYPGGKQVRGCDVTDWKKMPVGTLVTMAAGDSDSESDVEQVKQLGKDGSAPSDIAGEEYAKETTIYFLPDGRVKRGTEFKSDEWTALPVGTRVLVGYVYGGYVTAKRSAFDICGANWDDPATFYRFADGGIKPGNEVRENAIPKNTLVFYRN